MDECKGDAFYYHFTHIRFRWLFNAFWGPYRRQFQTLRNCLVSEPRRTKRAIVYTSRGFRPSDTNYLAYKLEILALKWAVCDKFYNYIYGNQIEIITNHNPLTYIFTNAKVDAIGQKWVVPLGNYDFRIS